MRHSFRLFCGLLITLALVSLPLPARATTLPPEPAGTTNSTPSTTSPQETGTSTVQPNNTQATPEEKTDTHKVHNELQSAATSGDASVANNEVGGSATTGSVSATATVLNVVNTNATAVPSFNTFQCNVTEDSDQHLLIDPTSLLPICTPTSIGANRQPTASAQGTQTGSSLTDILNSIALAATSGDASVASNGTAGNATSGNATTLATVANLVNTNIASKQAFLGVINIFGNLKGDIRVPRAIADGLLASTRTGSVVNSIDTTSITNTITATAQSGNATVTDNENGGNAASGNATTNITVLNLTGQQVIAKNSLLVFVNVLGKWMGMIVPAPGSTTAMLGSNPQDGTGSTITGSDLHRSNIRITNDITLKSQSGNASVASNRSAGNAASGSAAAGANVLNITNSNFVLDDWFGALFINVLGSWLGNFDIQDVIAKAENAATSDGTPDIVRGVQVFRFAEPAQIHASTPEPHNSSQTASTPNIQTTPSTHAISPANGSGEVLAVMAHKAAPATTSTNTGPAINFIALVVMLTGFAVIVATGATIIRSKLSL